MKKKRKKKGAVTYLLICIWHVWSCFQDMYTHLHIFMYLYPKTVDDWLHVLLFVFFTPEIRTDFIKLI